MNAGEDDIFSLLAWAEDEALKAHNKANLPPRTKGITEDEKHGWDMRERVFNELITRIKNMRVNQRPHVGRERV